MDRFRDLLQDKELLRTGNFIDGKWVDPVERADITVFNPATGEEVARVYKAGEEDLECAVKSAAGRFKEWRNSPVNVRTRILRKWSELLHRHKEDLAIIMTTEQGKPLHEATGEIKYAASYLEYYAEEVKRIEGDILPSPFQQSKILVLKQAVGVVGIITPWNFPAAMFVRKLAPALAAGCTCIVKPDERTPLTALAVMELGRRAGLPPGVVNMVTGDPPEIGAILATHKDIAKLSFTGSTRVGKILTRLASDSVKRLSLELGGNAPFIVFADTDLNAAVEGLIASKFRNAGQTCICVNRVFVESTILQAFVDILKEKVLGLRVGPGMEGCDVGPVIDRKAIEKLDRLVQEARSKGADLCCGGTVMEYGEQFYAPTILNSVTPDMDIFKEEIFGPIVSISSFETEEEAIRMANNTSYGLASYLFTQDAGRIWRVTEALEYGMVGVNTGTISTAWAPFGGVKQSGFGREGSKYGIEEYLQLKYINWSVKG